MSRDERLRLTGHSALGNVIFLNCQEDSVKNNMYDKPNKLFINFTMLSRHQSKLIYDYS
jgi:hypothetical protein